MNPNDDVTYLASQITGPENVMLVGHLPFMERLVSYLVTGTAEKVVVKFQNGGIVCLDMVFIQGSPSSGTEKAGRYLPA